MPKLESAWLNGVAIIAKTNIHPPPLHTHSHNVIPKNVFAVIDTCYIIIKENYKLN